MKRIFFLMIVLAVVFACSTQKNAVTVNKNNTDQLTTDSTEYDVETFDNKFEQWYRINDKPTEYRAQSYYENWNRQYVSAWNAKCRQGGRNWNFEPVVGYNPNEDYGFEMNHKLFYYFMYVENVLKVQILSGGPKIYEP